MGLTFNVNNTSKLNLNFIAKTKLGVIICGRKRTNVYAKESLIIIQAIHKNDKTAFLSC